MILKSEVNILPNISIGSGYVVGAGVVVTKDIDRYIIVADVPAKKLKEVEAN